MKKSIKDILKFIDGASLVQALFMLINGKIDLGIILSCITILLYLVLALITLDEKMEKGIKIRSPQDMIPREIFCKFYVIIVSIFYIIIYSLYVYGITSNSYDGNFGKYLIKFFIPSLINIILMIPIKYIAPNYSRKFAYVPMGVVISVYIESLIILVIEVFATEFTFLSIFILILGPFLMIIFFILPFLLSVLFALIIDKKL